MSKQQDIKGRFSARKKVEAVLQLPRDEDLACVVAGAKAHGTLAVGLARETFLGARGASPKRREPDAKDDELARAAVRVLGPCHHDGTILPEAFE